MVAHTLKGEQNTQNENMRANAKTICSDLTWHQEKYCSYSLNRLFKFESGDDDPRKSSHRSSTQ